MTPADDTTREKPMKVLLWQMKRTSSFQTLVLWDGENTYWDDYMTPSPGYKHLKVNYWRHKDPTRFALIGDL